MRRVYPYLNDPYRSSANERNDKYSFLKTIDDFINQKKYVRITLLTWNEEPIKEIQGELTNGTLTKDGSSSVRRTCTLQASVDGNSYTAEDMKMDYAVNKKIFLEIGIKNYSDQYPDYPILWFPQGVFYIASFSITSSATSSVNINVQLKDKMAALNGEIGGTFSATTILDTLETQSPEGETIEEKVLIYQIIQEMVNHIGGEALVNIVIEDVPLRIKKTMKWTGDNPLWMRRQGNVNSGIWYEVSLDPPADTAGWEQYINGDDVGYVYEDFTLPGELVANAGDSVVTMLDKIKETLGNYEYYYDEYGVFHFNEVKNYKNTTQATTLLTNMQLEDYLVETTTGKSVFNFSDDTNLISITANPQYNNIKNDYIVQGIKKSTDSDISYLVKYHLAIDQKPQSGNTYRDLVVYTEPETELVKLQFPLHISELPEVGNFNIIYMVEGSNTFYYWDENEYKEVEVIKYYPQSSSAEGYVTKDWRTEIYLRGLLARNNGTDAGQYYYNLQNHYMSTGSQFGWVDDLYNAQRYDKIDVDFYFEELDAFWPQIYNLETQEFYGKEEDSTQEHTAIVNGNYFLDFIDSTNSGFGEFAVSNIGRRTDVVTNEDINCLFEPEFPDIIFINIDDENADELRNECIENGQAFSQVRGDIYFGFAIGGNSNSCYEQIKYELYLHTSYQKTLSMTAIPAYYLEPNTRATINDKSTNTYGDFIINNISLPLGVGTMTVSASECTERYF